MESHVARELDYGLSMAAGALIKAMGMLAENLCRHETGQAPAYGEDAFQKVIEDFGVHHNGVLLRWKNVL